MLNKLLYSLLFSGMGFFSYLLLLNFTSTKSPLALVYTILVFNILGYTMIKISSWMNNRSPMYFLRRKKIVAIYSMVSALLFAINYGLMVSAKLLMNAEHPFSITSGLRIFVIVWLVELVIVNMLLVNRSISNSLKLQRQTAYLQKENDKARYAALQNQLNPHFLFNSLNTLIAEIEYNSSNAVEFTRNLSDVYRYVLRCQDIPMISLRDELEFMDAYLFLHQVRLGDCITVENSLSEKNLDSTLVPLTLQLLVENVIKHNYISQQKPMTIRLEICDDMLCVSNSINPKISNTSNGIGLQNLSNRCKLQLNKDIEVINKDDRFTVKVPLSYE